MNANSRIQWLHKKLISKSYPNSHRIAERFHISPRQAQRDLDFLKKKLGAPIAYDKTRRGFYYTEPFNLPLLLTSDNDDLYLPGIATVQNTEELAASESIIQMQIPYSATLEIPEKLAVMEMTPYITERLGKGRFVCEFHSTEKFIGSLIALESGFRVIEPEWLRERLIDAAERILKSHSKEKDQK